eukprot:sb/3474094/
MTEKSWRQRLWMVCSDILGQALFSPPDTLLCSNKCVNCSHNLATVVFIGRNNQQELSNDLCQTSSAMNSRLFQEVETEEGRRRGEDRSRVPVHIVVEVGFVLLDPGFHWSLGLANVERRAVATGNRVDGSEYYHKKVEIWFG